MKGWLVLEDGAVFQGWSKGVAGNASGEVVFNTAMTGYQEMLSDPSYTGQILVLCYPLTGNYGINQEDSQSSRIHLKGLVVSEACSTPNHWRSSGSLHDFMEKSGVPYLEGVDTRALVRHLRSSGSMKGVLAIQETAPHIDELKKEASAFHSTQQVLEATVSAPYTLEGQGPHMVVLDLGVKTNMIRHLRRLGCRVTVVPAFTTAKEILALSPAGVLLSNGPGDPKSIPLIVQEVNRLLGRVPVFGICLGNQVLSLALGADTFKMKFGHRGGNHPVQDVATGKIFISSQNHGYAVDQGSLAGTGLEVTHINLNDGTIEGLKHSKMPAVAVQFHPEGGPGPRDSVSLLEAFVANTARTYSRAG